jgi:O-acetyl-ADP-ribose deacetylase
MRLQLEIKIGKTTISLIKGDITKISVDAVVNAANSSLMGGGGVDGAIHRAGGPAILEECKEIVSKQGRLPTGHAVITTGGNLPAKYVIHTVGPVWHGGKSSEPELLKNAYLNCLKVGMINNLRSIAFSSISTGVYGYPVEKAGEVALNTITEFLKNENHNYEEIDLIVFSDSDNEVYKKLLEKY